jgi:mono/diheme cytochrome c family protein
MSNEPTPPNPKLEQAAASDESIQRVHDQLLHHQHEPKEGYTWMPLILLGLVSTVIFVVAVYFIHHRGDFSPMVYDERFDPATMGAKDVAAVDPAVAGRRHYTQACAQCHQPNGQGLAGAFPPLAGAEWVVGDEDTLIKILVHGLQGPIEVKGNTYNGLMPAFGLGSGFNWNDQRISEVLTYIRSEWGNDAPPITAEQVTAVRTQIGQRAQPWTVQELQQLQQAQ